MALGVAVWALLTIAGWWCVRPLATSRVLECAVKAEAGSVWAMEWVRASNGVRNGVWIEVAGQGEQRVQRRLPAYRVSELAIRPEGHSGRCTVEDATCAVRVFGVSLGRTDVPVTGGDSGVVLGVPTEPSAREQAVGLGVVGAASALVLLVPGALAGWWRRGLARRATPDALAWALVVSAHGWMFAWAPMLYCPDSMGYLAGAIRVLREHTLAGFEGPRVPGFGVVLAALWALPGEFAVWVGALHAIAGLGTAYAAWRLAQRCVSRGAGLVVLLLVGCSPLVLGWQRFVMSESLSALVVTLAAWLAVRQGRDAGFGRAAMGAVALGLVCAMGAYVRGNLQLLVVFVPLLLAAASWRRWGVAGAPALGAIALAVGVACVLPRAMWNLQEYGEAKLVVGEGYQRNLTTQMTGLMDDNQSGVLSPDEWRSLTKGRHEGAIDAYSAQDVWMRSDRLHAPAGLKGWGERSAKLDVPAMESIAREPAKAAKIAALGTLNILGLWRTDRWGFAENDYWSRPLRGIRPSTREEGVRTTNMWTGREIVESMSSLSAEDQERLWTRTNRDITRAAMSGHARLFARWWGVEDAVRPMLAGLFVIGGLVALVRRDGVMLVIALLVAANAAALAVLTLSGIDRYGVPYEPLLRIVAVYGAWRAWEVISGDARRGSPVRPSI